MKITVMINNKPATWDIHPGEHLLAVLRREGYKSVKNGCEEGECGACTILMDRKAVKSCILLAAQVNGHEITTVESLGTVDKPHVLQEEFVKAGAVQCGYCIPGMLLSAKALLDKNPNPTEAEIKFAIDGNLCRCTGYVKQLEAINNAAKRLRGDK